MLNFFEQQNCREIFQTFSEQTKKSFKDRTDNHVGSCVNLTCRQIQINDNETVVFLLSFILVLITLFIGDKIKKESVLKQMIRMWKSCTKHSRNPASPVLWSAKNMRQIWNVREQRQLIIFRFFHIHGRDSNSHIKWEFCHAHHHPQ